VTWRTALVVLIALASGIAVVLKIALRHPEPPAHQVFVNGDVLLMDADNTVAEAIAIRGGTIEAVGDSDDIMGLVTEETEVNDLYGRAILPGFIDAHGHFPGSALPVIAADLSSPPVGRITRMRQLLDALSERAAVTPRGDWVRGFGYDDTLLAEQRHPSRAELDAVSSQHPVAIMHVSGHLLVANSMALAMAGIGPDTPDPEGGVIGRREGSREPSGLLEETAIREVAARMLDPGLLAAFRMVQFAGRQYAAAGVTTAQAGGVDPRMLRGLRWFSRLGVIPQRLVVFAMQADWGDALLQGEFEPASYRTDRFNVAAVKLIADGSIQGYTAYLSEPYFTPYRGDADYRGYPTLSRDELFKRVAALHGLGYQLAAHGNGDAAIDDIIDAFEAAQRDRPVDDPRFILIHAQMARKDQLQRMRALGITPSFFSAHTWYWGDRHRDLFIGPQRAAVISPARWAADAGLRFSSHLDTPVTPIQPLQAVWSMVKRATTSGDVLGREQALTVIEALRAVTIDAAWQVREEANRGSLEAGKHADLVILSDNPLDDTDGLRDLKVERTLIGGVTVYRRR
jgi:predicted amidohydrolase YtcJ